MSLTERSKRGSSAAASGDSARTDAALAPADVVTQQERFADVLSLRNAMRAGILLWPTFTILDWNQWRQRINKRQNRPAKRPRC